MRTHVEKRFRGCLQILITIFTLDSVHNLGGPMSPVKKPTNMQFRLTETKSREIWFSIRFLRTFRRGFAMEKLKIANDHYLWTRLGVEWFLYGPEMINSKSGCSDWPDTRFCFPPLMITFGCHWVHHFVCNKDLLSGRDPHKEAHATLSTLSPPPPTQIVLIVNSRMINNLWARIFKVHKNLNNVPNLITFNEVKLPCRNAYTWLLFAHPYVKFRICYHGIWTPLALHGQIINDETNLTCNDLQIWW